MEYIKRDLERKFLHMSSAFKAVMVVGARQVGKSTMLKHLAEGQNRTYVTMDDTQLRNFAQTEPKLFLQTFQPPILIDEVQKAPELFERIKILCDESEEKGLFWLTGSQSKKLMRQAGVELNYTPSPVEIPLIPGDPERLKQVFLNLLDNAAKHGGDGKRVEVSISAEGQAVLIRIRDHGHGIPSNELPHVKEKFYKGSSKNRGTGIGLSVCDEIVARHGGKLIIENAEGGGCRVTISLPLRGGESHE